MDHRSLIINRLSDALAPNGASFLADSIRNLLRAYLNGRAAEFATGVVPGTETAYVQATLQDVPKVLKELHEEVEYHASALAWLGYARYLVVRATDEYGNICGEPLFATTLHDFYKVVPERYRLQGEALHVSPATAEDRAVAVIPPDPAHGQISLNKILWYGGLRVGRTNAVGDVLRLLPLE